MLRRELRTTSGEEQETPFFSSNIEGTSLASGGGMAFPRADLTHEIIGAFFKVFNELGHGYSEKIYRRALAIVLRELGHR